MVYGPNDNSTNTPVAYTATGVRLLLSKFSQRQWMLQLLPGSEIVSVMLHGFRLPAVHFQRQARFVHHGFHARSESTLKMPSWYAPRFRR